MRSLIEWPTVAIAAILIGCMALPAQAAKTVFVDGNAASRTPGTKATAAFFNAVNNHRHDGKAVDGSGILDYAADAGSVNALAITLAPALTAHVPGMPIYIKVGTGNTGATTLAVNALAAVAVVHRDGSALLAGDLVAGEVIGVAYNGSAYQLLAHDPPVATNIATVGGQTATQLAPPGAIIAMATPTVPSGWLACNGQAVSRTAYAALFAALGTTWGSGDNVTTFQLPDLRGYFLRGWDDGRGVDTDRVFGTTQADDVKSHSHDITTGDKNNAGATTTSSYTINASGLNTGTTAAAGGTETRPKNIAVFYVIKY